MRWIHRLAAGTEEPVGILGGKAHGLVVLLRLGLPVPPGFVLTTEVGRAFLRDGRPPPGLDAELAAAVADLEAAVRRGSGDTGQALRVSVRSGGSVSMPGMMDTLLDIGLAPGNTGALERAIEAVAASWDTPRARTYRDLHGIPQDLGTAVTVQAMVFGDRDDRSAGGVAFSRDPDTGEPVPFGEVLFGRRGDDVVSGRTRTRPLHGLADRLPAVAAELGEGLRRIEQHYRDACYVEFTVEAGTLWFLQVRPARLVGRAAVRVAVDLADDGVIDRSEAVRRVSPEHLRQARTPRIARTGLRDVLVRGIGASPGVASGRVATSADRAVRMAVDGPVLLVRPETSPLDLHGIAAAAGLLTARGGPASHAAVVARAMGVPAVVGAADLVVEAASSRAGDRVLPEGTLITLDGTGGEVVLGRPRVEAGSADPHLARLLGWARGEARP
ncbi:MAG: PEP-utilizing enzyme [Pseudonocardia sp.]|nr:PEP-utilizing enzyme [Pseudonocardia sp.]